MCLLSMSPLHLACMPHSFLASFPILATLNCSRSHPPSLWKHSSMTYVTLKFFIFSYFFDISLTLSSLTPSPLPNLKCWNGAFPGGSVAKNLPANVGDAGSIFGSGRSPREGNGNPLQYSWLENPKDRGAWQAFVAMGPQKSQTWLSN